MKIKKPKRRLMVIVMEVDQLVNLKLKQFVNKQFRKQVITQPWFSALSAAQCSGGGEAAGAKALGIYGAGSLGAFKAKDVGKHQVRTTHHPDGCLILHKTDLNEDIFLLVTGLTTEYELRGWTQGFEG